MRRLAMLLLSLPALAAAQSSASTPSVAAAPPAAELQAAASAFNASKWSEANALYSSLADRYPAYPLARFRKGVTLTELGHPAEAEPLLRNAEALGVPVPQAAYRLSESLAEQHKPDLAIAELRRAANAGMYLPPAVLTSNAHLASLRQRPEWAGVMGAFDAVVHPCLYGAKFREFDFWVGDWDVRPSGAPASTPASRNNITLEENGCIVQEHWVGAGGGSTGQSFNIYDRSMGKWRQTWVDNSAGQHDYVGSLVNGNMVFEGTTPVPSGQLGRVPTRLILFHVAQDTVRQLSQISSDSGKTWSVAYDFIYVRRPGSK